MLKCKCLVYLLCIWMLFACTSNTGNKFNDPIVHIVVIWLKDPSNEEHIDKIIRTTKQLESIPEIKKIRVGKSIASDRKIVDDSFDVAIYMTFNNISDMEQYLEHPDHKDAVSNILQPLTTKLMVYDFFVTD